MNKFSTIGDISGRFDPLFQATECLKVRLARGFSGFSADLYHLLDILVKLWKTPRPALNCCQLFRALLRPRCAPSLMFHMKHYKQKPHEGGFACFFDFRKAPIRKDVALRIFYCSTQEPDGIKIVSSVKSSLSTILLLTSTPESFTASISLSIEE